MSVLDRLLGASRCDYCGRKTFPDARLCRGCLERRYDAVAESLVKDVHAEYSTHVAAVQDAFYQPAGGSDD